MAQLDEVKDKISLFEKEVVGRLSTIEERITHLITKAELSALLAEHSKPDWAGRTKFIAALVGSGGLGVAILKIVEAIVGG